MTKLARYALAVATVAAALATPAHAAPPPGGPVGDKCSFTSVTDVTREAGWQTGEIEAGPLVTGEAGTLVCSIHVNNDTHSGAAAVTESVNATGGVVALMPPRALSYQATDADDVALCTAWVGSSGTLYWVGGNPATGNLGHWSTNAGDGCGVAASMCVTAPDRALCVYW
jgi:hypothetical protein